MKYTSNRYLWNSVYQYSNTLEMSSERKLTPTSDHKLITLIQAIKARLELRIITNGVMQLTM